MMNNDCNPGSNSDFWKRSRGGAFSGDQHWTEPAESWTLSWMLSWTGWELKSTLGWNHLRGSQWELSSILSSMQNWELKVAKQGWRKCKTGQLAELKWLLVLKSYSYVWELLVQANRFVRNVLHLLHTACSRWEAFLKNLQPLLK